MNIRTDYREMTLDQSQIENFLAQEGSITPEFRTYLTPDGANVRLIFTGCKLVFSKYF